MEREMRDYQEGPEEDVVMRTERSVEPRCRAILCTAVGVCAVLFAGSWLATTCAVLNARTLGAAGFTAFFGHPALFPRLYVAASYAFEVLVTVVAGATSVAVCYHPSKARARTLRTAWAVLLSASVVFLALLVAANASIPALKKSVDARKDEFDAAFNAFYCDLRATQACLDAGNSAALTEMFAASSSSAAALWSSCRPLLVSHEGSLTSRQSAFLLSCNATQAVDAWCGAFLTADNASSSEAAWSPAAVNPGKFHTYQEEWPSHVHLDSFYLGVVLVCVAALCGMLRAIKDDGGDGFQVVAAHTPSTDKPEPEKPSDSVSIEMARRF